MTQRLGSILSDTDLPLAELCAIRMDGEVFSIDSCFSPVDQPAGILLRAGSLSRLAPVGTVAEGASALWIYGILPAPPARHELCVDVAGHARAERSARFSVREIHTEQGDVVTLGGMAVMAPLRILVDFARLSKAWGVHEAAVARELIAAGNLRRPLWRGRLDQHRHLPYKRRALARIEEAAFPSAVVRPVHVIDPVDTPDRVEHTVQMRRVTHFEHEPADRQSIA